MARAAKLLPDDEELLIQHSQHPLRARRRPGPPGAESAPAIENELEDAARILELVDQGVLPADGPPPLPIAVDAMGKPKKRLTAEDEQALAWRIQTWGDIDARNALVLANLGLVHLVANQMRRSGVRYEDMVQEGTLGLLRATETFEPDRGVRFSTYCVYWIRAKIQRLLQRLDRDDTPSIASAEMETLAGGRRRRPSTTTSAPAAGCRRGTQSRPLRAPISQKKKKKKKSDRNCHPLTHTPVMEAWTRTARPPATPPAPSTPNCSMSVSSTERRL